ncbi:DUF3987 domain-containing protein [Methylococcus sp. EFPC2]|uniref:DUF3987 domain-containing protein n=1 Tax=Methylococcus sp. EFPC2 TaxID=2812648 RepID=UPI0019681AEC|nr:DUF3987 domain-containing protein [Methylococcus sp. EFPC2]QSA98727.1 DUF3987 domain-containing protein [Methylococcus sp. EFPC2]
MTDVRSDTLSPDFTEAARFLSLLAEGEEAFTFQTFDDLKSRKDKKLAHIFHGDLESCASALADLNKRGSGVFVTVNETDGHGRKLENIVRIRAVWHEEDTPCGITEWPLEPQLVIESSPGKFHRYWPVDGLTPAQFTGVMERMIADYGSDPNVKDTTRVLRLPGFWHLKNPAAPFRVRIVHESGGLPYSASRLLEAFPMLERAAVSAPVKPAGDLPPGAHKSVVAELAGRAARRTHEDPTLGRHAMVLWLGRECAHRGIPVDWAEFAVQSFAELMRPTDTTGQVVAMNFSGEVKAFRDAHVAGLADPADKRTRRYSESPTQTAPDDAVTEGARNKHLARMAGALRRSGVGAGAILEALRAENGARCHPPLPAGEVEGVWKWILREQQPTQAAGPAENDAVVLEWPDPSLPTSTLVPDIPADVLPGYVGAMAGAVAEATQTPPAMAVLFALSTLATVLQRRFLVAPFGSDYTEPLSLWTLVALPSGSRKTAVINALSAVLARWEKLERDRMRGDIARNAAAREVAEKRIERLKAEAAKASTADDREALTAEIQREKELMPLELRAPRLFSGDINSEGLQRSLVEYDGMWSVLTDEGGIFAVMAGLHTGGLSSLDVFLQAHAGTHLRVDRAGRSAYVDRPALSFGMALQPGILRDAAKSRKFRDSGLLARFLFGIPPSNVGTRDVRRHSAISETVKEAWESNIMGLLDSMERPLSAPVVLPFDQDALSLWLDFSEELEREQGAGGRYAHIADWTSKLPGAVARVAGLLELAIHGVDVRRVRQESVARAVALGRLLIPHAEAAFSLMGAGVGEDDALALLAWIRAQKLERLHRREAQQALRGRFPTLDKLKSAVEQLGEWHVLGPEIKERASEKGGRPSAAYVVNPKVHVA